MNNNIERLFLFCIGGSGSRVLKSLVFLLASGVKFPVRQLVPIIVDPDKDSGEVESILKLLSYYQNIRSKIDINKSDFFNRDISQLSSSIGDNSSNLSSSFRSDLVGSKTSGETFRNFIDYDYLDYETKLFIKMLYDEEKNLDSDLTIGFKGNPNMGSVVLNKFQHSNDFKAFANALTSRDAVFVVSSIFGGTGASGFPLLVKNLRAPHENYVGNSGTMKSVPLGAVSVLPYFKIESNNGPINSDTFVAKTKAALSFYGDDLDGINALYYIGDSLTKEYENNPGGLDQRNKAHMVELISALAIVDFAEKDYSLMRCDSNGKAINPKYYEYGIQEDSNNKNQHKLDFYNLGNGTKKMIAEPLTRFYYMYQYLTQHFSDVLKNRNQPFIRGANGIALDESLLRSDFFLSNLQPFCNLFFEWLSEISENQRSLQPFKLETRRLNEMVYNVKQAKLGFFSGSSWEYDDFNSELNVAEKVTKGLTTEQKLITILSLATKSIFEKRIKTELLGN